MNEQLNTAISHSNADESYNHYLNAILSGEIKTLADFAAYVDSNFWNCIWDQASDPVESMNYVISNLKEAGKGNKCPTRIDDDMEKMLAEGFNIFDNFADRMTEEAECVLIALKYLNKQKALS